MPPTLVLGLNRNGVFTTLSSTTTIFNYLVKWERRIRCNALQTVSGQGEEVTAITCYLITKQRAAPKPSLKILGMLASAC